jgi:Ankyrin repeats (3 copies)
LLATLPPTLDETYRRILRSIDKKNNEDAMYTVRILHWLLFSARLLLLEEIAEAAAIDPERETPFNRDEVLEDPSDVLDICSSLVTLTTISPYEISRRYNQQPQKCEAVILAHYSVQEYLSSNRLQGRIAQYSATSSACHAFIASSCLGYLHHLDEADFFSTHRVEDVKLGVYSSQFWTRHAREAPTDERITQSAVALLSRSNAAYCNWIQIHDPDKSWKGSDITRDPQAIPEPLCYACLEGLAEVAGYLITIEGADVNAQGGYYGNALQAASSRGHDKVVEVLLAKGANVNAQGGRYGNALQAASFEGHDKVIKILLTVTAERVAG